MEYFQSLAADGQLDSEGSFTLAGDKALQKLSEFALADKNEWILKAVQSAVAVRGEALLVKITRGEVKIDFHLPTMPEHTGLEQCVLNPGERLNPFWKELVIALRTLLSHHRYNLQFKDGTDVLWDGAIFSRQQRRASREPELTMIVSTRPLRQSGLRPSFFRARDAAALTALLHERAVYAPLSLRVDGRTPKVSFSSQHSVIHHSSVSPTYLLHAAVLTKGGLEEGVLAPSKFLRDPLHSPEPFLSFAAPQGRERGAQWDLFASFHDDYKDRVSPGTPLETVEWVYRRPLKECFQLHLTRLGVVCRSYRFPDSSLGGSLQVRADQLGSDVTGLALEIRGNALLTQDLIKEVNGTLYRLVFELKAHRSRVSWSVPRERIGLGLSTMGLTGLVLGGALGGMMGPFGIWAGGALGSAVAASWVFPLKRDYEGNLNELVLAVQKFHHTTEKIESRLEGFP